MIESNKFFTLHPADTKHDVNGLRIKIDCLPCSHADPPEIEIEQNWYERDGEVEVELICVVHAKPEASVSWYRRQKLLHETDRQIFQEKSGRNTLHIRKIDPVDFGNYSCRAQNSLGKARTYTSLSGNLLLLY